MIVKLRAKLCEAKGTPLENALADEAIRIIDTEHPASPLILADRLRTLTNPQRLLNSIIRSMSNEPELAAPSPCGMKRRGPPLWKEFHEWTLTKQENPDKWLGAFQSRLQCSECETELLVIRKDLPFQPGFEWGVEVHNRVNAKLGKPILSVEQAALVAYPQPQTPDPQPPQQDANRQ